MESLLIVLILFLMHDIGDHMACALCYFWYVEGRILVSYQFEGKCWI